ncbi:MAG TPA: protein kinase [Anaerolineales bacterium]|jgi:serine/threonine protein kinase|nr:protein kinase [Anaerolineales bacterium]
MADWIGRTLGRVKIESLIARGGMAEVYLGTHTTLQREVAVKILRNAFEEEPRVRERFELEAQAVAKLRHPNIVQVYDFDTVDGQPYIIMEYIRGPSLSRYLSVLHGKNGRLELPLVSRLLTGVASALQYAHESGVVHRDVKPGNILLTSRSLQIVPGQTIPLDFEPVLTDFGLVRILNSNRQTTVGATAGTPAYMSPEQAMGLPTDGRTDIYSLGIVLYEMLSGNVPFDGETTMSVLLKHLNEAPAPIPGLSPALQAVLDRALTKTADDRFDTPKEFAAAFEASLEETSDATTLLSTTRLSHPAKADRTDTPPTKSRNFWRPALLAGGLIAVVAAAAFFRGAFPLISTETPTPVPPSETPTLLEAASLGPTGVLQFHDGIRLLDRATLLAQAMPAPPTGSQYEVWLVDGDERLSLGTLSVDSAGRGSLTFDNPRGENLLAAYGAVKVTIESGDSSDANGTERVAYFYSLPESGLIYLRGLLVSLPTTPEKVGLIHGLAESTDQLTRAARDMLSNYESGNEENTRKNAEAMLNLLVGDQSQEYKDWNGDEHLDDPGDGYGLLLNGNHLGYIQAVYSQADYAVNASGASRNMIVNGESAKLCTQNLARWAPELRDHLLTLLDAESLSDMRTTIQRSAALAEQLLNGIDLNENGMIEQATGECGVLAVYEATYRMADMPLLPVNPLDTPTISPGLLTPSPTATYSSSVFASPTKEQEDEPSTYQPSTDEPPVVSTNPPPNPPTHGPPPRPTREPRPTKEPRPTQRPRPTPRN